MLNICGGLEWAPREDLPPLSFPFDYYHIILFGIYLILILIRDNTWGDLKYGEDKYNVILFGNQSSNTFMKVNLFFFGFLCFF